MLFSSVGFLFRFLPIFMIIYLAFPGYRNLILLLGSLIFYGVGEPYFVLLLLLSVLINYGFSRYMFWEPRSPQTDRKKKALRRRKMTLTAAITFDLAVLFLFKYWDFAAGSVNALAGKTICPLLSLALPLGISFYTFQMLSYLIDLYRGTEKRSAGFLSFATYVCMFPQLIAGPIVRYGEVSARMAGRRVRIRDIENGFKLFTLGLGLKVLLANQIGTLWNLIMTAGAGRLHMLVAWLGAFAYSFQLYFDFWGYSAMAMGLGKMLGFSIPRNFDNPYVARSVSEFWRRWHMTLGSWFREYVYFPLGGSRMGRMKTVRNLFIVWALTGLWHGADWNFVLWGVVLFLLIALEKTGFGKWLENSRVVGHIYLLLLIPATWVIFAITDMGQLAGYMGNLAGYHREEILVGTTQLLRYLKEYGALLIACVIFATHLPGKAYWKWKDRWFVVLPLFGVFWWAVYEIVTGSNNPFLYFRF